MVSLYRSAMANLIGSSSATESCDLLERNGFLSERALGERGQVIRLIQETRKAFPTFPAPGHESWRDVDHALARAGFLSPKGLSEVHLPPVPPPEKVVEMRDQDGGRSSCPSHFRGWLEVMKPGDCLTFVHEEGGQLVVKGPARGPFSVACSDPRGQVLAEAARAYNAQVCTIVEDYIRGNTQEVISQLRHLQRPTDSANRER